MILNSGRFGVAGRVALFFGALFLVAGVKLPYLPVWLDWRGLTAGEIAIVAAAPLFLRIFATPVVAVLADRRGNHRGVVVGLAWCSLVMLCTLALSEGFGPVLAVTLVMALVTTSIMPLTEAIAMDRVRRAGADYGRMRLWGSLSFIGASFAAGFIVERFGAHTIVPLLIVGGAVTVMAAHLLPRPEPTPAEAGQPAPKPRATLADLGALLQRRWFVLFLIGVGGVQAAHAVFYTFGVLHWKSIGHSEGMAGVLWGIGVIAEIAIFAWSGALVRRVGALTLVGIGAAASVLRWVAMALDPPLALLLPLQALHGLTYGATHLGAIHYMSARIQPEQSGTAQAIYASVTHGIAMGAATLLAGRLFPEVGARSYLAMAVLAAMGLLAVLALARMRTQPHSARGGE